MNRRQALQAGSLLGMATAFPRWAQAAVADTMVFDRLLQDGLTASPQTATMFGLDQGEYAGLKRRLDDRSRANQLNLYSPFIDAAARLAALPLKADPRRRQWLETFRWYADAAKQMRGFDGLMVSSYGYPVPYAISQLNGAYFEVPDMLATQHTIETAADCEAYLSRLAALAVVIDQDTAVSKAQATAGTVPPDFICNQAMEQLRSLANARGPSAGLVQGLVGRARAKGIAGDWEHRAVALVDGPVGAALGRQLAHMSELRRRAIPAAGIGQRPNGAAFYAMALAFHITTANTPDEVHRIGLEQVAEIQAEADALMTRLGYRGGSVVARMNALSKDPAQLFPNTDAGRDALLAFARERIVDVDRRLGAAFSRRPRMGLEFRRMSRESETGSPGAVSLPGSMDGSRPDLVYFNLASTGDWPKWQLPSTVYHEGTPGHHFQGALLAEAGGVPTLLKVILPNAYNEGWALYAEQVADELGVYDEMPLGRLGRLQQSLFRACRLVVDTGIHAQGWSRERATAYMVEQGGLTPDNARGEVDRYAVWPGQACSYKIGHLEFLRQRAAAKARLGTRFSIQAFHDAVLLGGGMPLAVMNDMLTETMKA